MFGGGDKPDYEIADVYTGMRDMVLNLNTDQISELNELPVWAVLMETGYDSTVVTVVAIAEGTASLYFSNGGGMIGLGEHENVRPACFNLVKKSAEYLKEMEKAESYPLPKKGETVFYVVTSDGIYTYRAKEADLGHEKDELSPLFYDGQELITQMRIADEKRRAEQGS